MAGVFGTVLGQVLPTVSAAFPRLVRRCHSQHVIHHERPPPLPLHHTPKTTGTGKRSMATRGERRCVLFVLNGSGAGTFPRHQQVQSSTTLRAGGSRDKVSISSAMLHTYLCTAAYRLHTYSAYRRAYTCNTTANALRCSMTGYK